SSRSYDYKQYVQRPYEDDIEYNRIISPLAFSHRAHAPAGKELFAHQVAHNSLCLVILDDPAPEQVPDVRGQRINLPPITIDGECEEFTIFEPVVLVEASFQFVSFLLQLFCKCRVVQQLPGEARTAPLRVIDVALDLACCARQARERAIGERDGVPGVLPAMVLQPRLLVAAVVLDIAI